MLRLTAWAVALGCAVAENEKFRLRNALMAVPLPSPDPRDKPGEWHGQADQDRHVNILLPQEPRKQRYFIDLAANHWIYRSNTRALERDHGWDGLCIEGQPSLMQNLLVHRTCAVASVAIAKHEAVLPFYLVGNDGEAELSGLGIGGADNQRASFQRRSKNAKIQSIKVNAVNFGHLLREAKVPRVIDFLSLDVEGAEHLVMESFPWDQHVLYVLSVERPKLVLQQSLMKHGFVHICNNFFPDAALGQIDVGDQMWLSQAALRLPTVRTALKAGFACGRPWKNETFSPKPPSTKSRRCRTPQFCHCPCTKTLLPGGR